MPDIFAIWKPKGPSSNAVMNQIRKALGTRKVGHAGTLDPLAEGILVVGVGRVGTARLKDFAGGEKEYLAEVRLGMTSSTDDEEGEKTISLNTSVPSRDEVNEVIRKFVGNIEQTPPIFSALKIKGVRAYKLARRGDDIKLKPRPAFIKSIELLGYVWPIISLKVVTGPGVYIRALARDIGAKLLVGGYLASLTRTRVGEFGRAQALSIEEVLTNLSHSPL